MFFGIKAAVLVIVVEALLRIARRALKNRQHWIIAGLSFLAIFTLALPFPMIIAAAAIFGFLRGTDGTDAPQTTSPPAVPLADTLRTIALWLAIWILPLVVLAFVVGQDNVLAQLSLFFSKLAIVTFGGAYAVLAYMAETVVTTHGWLEPGQMLDGLGLAETTPGPLILVTEFVGFLAAFRNAGQAALAFGFAGAAVALWATFTPCFLWIFAGAPYIEWINTQPRLRNSLSAITAAVVGVILNLAVWFALHVFFARVTLVTPGPFRIWIPDLVTLDWRVVALALVSGFLLLRLHWGIPAVLLAAACMAFAIRLSGF
jgi:chromate transporter